MHQTGFTERFAYGLGDLASNFANATVNFFIIFYYTNVMHVNSGAVGTIILIAMFADSIFDVIMGIAVDKTNTRMGKARPWIIRMCIPFAVIFILLFSVPDIGSYGKTIYVFITYLLFNLIYSAVNIPYGILNSLIAHDQYERSVINIFRSAMAYGTIILISSVTLGLVNHMGGNAAAWRNLVIVYALVALGAFLLTFSFTKERPVGQLIHRQEVSVSKGLRALLKNKFWLMLVLAAVLIYIAFSAVNGITIYYAQIFLHSSRYQSILTICFYIPIAAGSIFMAPLIRRFGKRNLAFAGVVLAILGSLIMLIDPHSLGLILFGNLLRGLGLTPVFGNFFAMVADTIEYGHWKTGVRTEGLVYSASSFGIKLGSGIGAALIGWTLALSGYKGGAVTQPVQAVNSIWALYLLLPVVLFAALLFILSFYKLDKLYPDIIAELNNRRETGSETAG